jgi:hypothetical protein
MASGKRLSTEIGLTFIPVRTAEPPRFELGARIAEAGPCRAAFMLASVVDHTSGMAGHDYFGRSLIVAHQS